MSERVIHLDGRRPGTGNHATGPMTVGAFSGGDDGPCLQFTLHGAGAYSQLTLTDVLKLQAAVERWVLAHNALKEGDTKDCPAGDDCDTCAQEKEIQKADLQAARQTSQELREHTHALEKIIE